MRSTSLPVQNGARLFSIAATMANDCSRLLAEPRPYNPGSLVITLTNTQGKTLALVPITLISLIASGGRPRVRCAYSWAAITGMAVAVFQNSRRVSMDFTSIPGFTSAAASGCKRRQFVVYPLKLAGAIVERGLDELWNSR